MTVTYDEKVDIAYFTLKDEKSIESEEIKNGIIVDYNDKNEIIGIEILNFSKTVKREKNDR
jgi:uncharacterized protein YuzE